MELKLSIFFSLIHYPINLRKCYKRIIIYTVKRIVKNLLIVLGTLLLLSGCCRLDMDVRTYSDASILIKGKMLIAKSQLDQLDMNIDGFRSLMVSYGLDFLDEKYSFEEKTIDEKDYAGISFECTSSKYFETKAHDETVTLTIHKPNEDEKIGILNSNGKSLFEFLESVDIKAEIKVHMPGRIIEANTEHDRKNLTINPLAMDEDIIIVSRTMLFDFIGNSIITVSVFLLILMYSYPLKEEIKEFLHSLKEKEKLN